jgi:hypothetical protein
VAEHARASFPAIGVSFGDVHCAVALAGAGNARWLARWVELLREGLAQGRVPAGRSCPPWPRRCTRSRRAGTRT